MGKNNKNKHGGKAKEQPAAIKAPLQLAAWASLDTKIKRVSKKPFLETLERWSSIILVLPEAGAAPKERVVDNLAMEPVLKKVPRVGEERHSVSGVRAGILHESLHMLHKAWHVGAICATNIQSGCHTWAEIDAYQSSLFAMGATLGFLGISFPTPNALVDVFPSAENSTKNELPKDEHEIQLIGFQSLDHYVKWAILQRVLRNCDADSLPRILGNALSAVPDHEFARRRNSVFYQTGWLRGDLFVPLTDPHFGKPSSEAELFDSLRQQDDNFGISLMLALLKLSYAMASQIGTLSATVAGDIALLAPHIKKVRQIWDVTG